MKVENPTSRDIADIAGVSQATVSRALRNSPLVRPETRERILSALIALEHKRETRAPRRHANTPL